MKTILQNISFLLITLVATVACQTSQTQQENKEQTKPTEEAPATNPRTDSLTKVFNEGKRLFANCAQCHTTTRDKMVGPGLQGVLERRRVDWVIAFIENSQKLIASGDKEAVALYNEYNKTQMQSFKYSPEEMPKLLFYMANLGRKPNEYITLDELPKIKKK
ncbi:hypothetical protein BKI52_27365 [marine bacterium AO1-C]|nr:hypothetical protein BKI52_27365 [marine bacterium AO1-C]